MTPKKPKKPVYNENSIYKDLKADPAAWKLAKPYFDKSGELRDEESESDAAKEAFGADPEVFLADTTLRNVLNMSGGRITYREMRELIDKLNG